MCQFFYLGQGHATGPLSFKISHVEGYLSLVVASCRGRFQTSAGT